ncbi:MAG: CHAT domain-containing protein, partial [Caldilineaceae bacterium]|nr:CHAT domain-containing protein [Caldilineaceae bacterium]
RIALWHYAGHANGYQLLLEDDQGQRALADAGGLADFLAQQRGLELVFLNGCSTQPQVQGLLDAGISAVIATAQAIDDAVATRFAECFYQSLAG